MSDQIALYRLPVVKVRRAIDEIEALMLSDIWDSMPPQRQRSLAEVAQQLRSDLAPIESALGEPLSDWLLTVPLRQ